MLSVGLMMLTLLMLFTLLTPLLVPIDPLGISAVDKLLPPSLDHLLGTDELGRDQLSRLVVGSGISLRIAVAATALTAIFGIGLGMVSGQYPAIDIVVSQISDSLLIFPGVVLAIMILAALGPSELNVIIAVFVLYVPRVIRTVRAAVIEYRDADFVQAARSLGASDLRVLVLHIFPRAIGPTMVQLSLGFSSAILVEAGLSFLGLGAPPPAPTWGGMISGAREYIRTAPWLMIAPGAIITYAVLSLNLIGDGLRDMLDPRSRAAGQ
ncbi:MAG: ABC transporter permease [Devosia sp.]|nr:ABC transporter permease [Devosia sp.]